jgi:hypothetical protein
MEQAMNKRQFWFRPDEVDLLRISLDEWLCAMASAENGTPGGVRSGTKKAHQFTRRRIDDMQARLAQSEQTAA